MTEEELKGKTLVDLLDLLEEVPPPPPVSLLPQTPSWLILGLLILAGALYVVYRLRARYRAEAYRQAALAELDRAATEPAHIAAVLRRTALAAFPRDQVAGLYGDDWLRFLDQSFPGSGFVDGPGRDLTQAAYRDTPTSEPLGALARDWIRRHKRNGGA